MQYIGDISKYDYEVLKELAQNSSRILEFGVGASTQILANYTKGTIDSVDTSEDWIKFTKINLKKLGVKNPVTFHDYEEFQPQGEYDLFFNDGVGALRNHFAINIWRYIKIGGKIAFHDTRREKDISYITSMLLAHQNEIDLIEVNKNSSNITIVRKKKFEPLYNWKREEGRKQVTIEDVKKVI